jgi:serine/threonine protein kinase
MEPLGSGSQGTTFRGVDRADGSEVAVKVLSLSKVGDWKGFDLFERECRVLARLNHPNIPRFIDHYASEQSGDYFLVMQLVHARNLRQIVEEDGGLGPEQIQAVFKQCLEVLAYLQAQTPPIIHRDIKPSNLLLDAQGHLHLIDFGGVRDALKVDGGSTIVGTFGYMAPEQLHGEATGATDLYALGATIVSLLTGVDPQDMPRKGLGIDLDRLLPRHRWRGLLGALLEPSPAERVGDARVALKRLQVGGAATAKVDSLAPKTSTQLQPRAPMETPGLPALQDDLRELARGPRRPLAVLIWLLTAVGSGFLTLVQAIFLPLFYKFLSATRISRKPRDTLAREEEEAQLALQQQRRTLTAIADAAHPFRGDEEGR